MEREWYVLKKIGMHTLTNGSAIVSFAVSTYVTKCLVKDDALQMILDRIESFVLVVLILIFASQLIYDVLPEKIRALIISLFARKLVFA